MLDASIETITSHVNTLYPDACIEGKCTPCFSLIRKYEQNGRTGVPMHFDVQALVTVVIPLNDGYEGGLFVGTEREKRYIDLNAGDAVLHQSNLFHGVNCTGVRWSLIFWYKDTPTCSKMGHASWLKEMANDDPVRQFLYFHVTRAEGIISADTIAYLKKSSDAGFSRAMNELGELYRRGGPSITPDLVKAKHLFEKAALAGSFEATANLGQILIEEGVFDEAIRLFRIAAEEGNVAIANQNLGVAAFKGLLSGKPDAPLAIEYLLKSGSSDALLQAADIAYASGNDIVSAQDLYAKSARLGNAAAARKLGLFFLEGTFDDDDAPSAGISWLEKAIGMGDEEAGRILAAFRAYAQNSHREL